MLTYVIRRPGLAADVQGLDRAVARLRAFERAADALPARWLTSFALREADGRYGLACVFLADGVASLHRHAALTGVPAPEILPVAATLLVRALAPSQVWLVRRRGFWKSAAELERSAAASRRVGEEDMPTRVCWLRSYAVHERNGTLGSVCLFQSVDADALREHARRAGLPADEIAPVLGCHVLHEPVAQPPP